MREIIQIQVGQCGNQIGTKVLFKILGINNLKSSERIKQIRIENM